MALHIIWGSSDFLELGPLFFCGFYQGHARMSDGSKGALGGGYNLRRLSADDYHKGFLKVLEQLTVVGDLSEEKFREVLDKRLAQADTYVTVVVEHEESEQIVATGTLMIEAKFIHGGSPIGHAEDIVVDSKHRGKGLARAVMNVLADEAEKADCYKVILDCHEENIPLYEKCGYRVCERQMRLDLPRAK